MKNRVKGFFSINVGLLLLFTTAAVAQGEYPTLRDSVATLCREFERSYGGTVGVAVRHLEKNDTASYRGRQKFPMQSVYKFPLAMAMLDAVDKGRFTLDQKIHVTKKDLLPDTWSPLQKKYPEGNVLINIRDLIQYTVSQSDNSTCDILFRLLGGTQAVNTYVHGLGVKDMAIVATEEEMHAHWDVQFTNWCHPTAMLQLLEIFYNGKKLSPYNRAFLLTTMIETTTGAHRLKGLLPEGTVVAHKTGTGGPNKEGVTGAVNDAGIITLPDGQHVAVVVYVTRTVDVAKAEALIAAVANAVYAYYSEP